MFLFLNDPQPSTIYPPFEAPNVGIFGKGHNQRSCVDGKRVFFLREGSGDEENIHILLWYLEKWCVCIYKYHETPFSMKSKIFGHLKPRLLTIKTSKKCRFGGPMLYIYIYINIIIHKQYPWFYMYQSVFLRDRNLPPPEFHPFFQLTSGSSIHDDQAAFLL